MELNESNFESEAIESTVPVLIDFFAPWCGPCRMLIPVLEKLEIEFGETAKVCKVNVDENPELATRYKVGSIPHIIFMKEGIIEDQIIGFPGEEVLREKLTALR